MNKDTIERVKEATTVTINRDAEDRLRGLGVDIPLYPMQGDITYNGNKIGSASKFNGVNISDDSFIISYVDESEILWYVQ